jgi:hypothetical protein
MLKNGRSRAAGSPLSAKKSCSCCQVRSDSGVGITGTSTRSLAANRFSLSKVMLGGASSTTRS